MEYSGKGTSCEMEIDKLQYPTSNTSRRRRDAPNEQHSNFPLQPLYQKTVVDKKEGFSALYVGGAGQGWPGCVPEHGADECSPLLLPTQ